MSRLTNDSRQEICLSMAGLAGADAREKAGELAVALGVSEGTVYRASKESRITRPRSNGGRKKIKISKETLEKMLAFTLHTDCPATDVVEIFEGNGEIDSGRISAAWFSRWLKSQEMSRKDLKKDRRPCRRFEASEPGEVYQIDATIALQFYIDDDGSVGWESTVSRNKNRPGNRKKRLVLLAAIDDHSRCVYAEFTTGQTVNHWLNFLFNTFKKKGDPRFYFFGIPRTIYMDNDTIARTSKFAKAMAALGIKVKKHKPTKKDDRFSNARSKGKIERFLLTLSEKQKRTKLEKFSSIDEANQFLIDECLKKNNSKHATTGDIPIERWNRIRPEMLVKCEDDRLYEILYRDEYECRVYNDMTLRLDGTVWQLNHEEPFFQMIGQRVTVFRHPLEKGRIFVEWNGGEYLVERQGAEVRSWAEGPIRLPQSEREKRIAGLEKIDLSGLKLWGFDKGPAPGVVYTDLKEGVALDTTGLIPSPPMMSRADAFFKISGDLGRPLSREENRYLRDHLGEQVTDDEIAQATESLADRAREIKAG